MLSEMPSDDFRSEFLYLTGTSFPRPECLSPGHVLYHFAAEAKTHLFFAGTPSKPMGEFSVFASTLSWGGYMAVCRWGGSIAPKRAEVISRMPSDDFGREFSYLTEKGFPRSGCYPQWAGHFPLYD